MSRQDDLQRLLASRPEVRLAVLFGSAARGADHRDSDLDVGVLLSSRELEVKRALERDLERAAGCSVDVVYLDEAAPLVRFEIARDGQVMVEREPYLWANVKARAMLDWWDWAPLARRFHRAAARRLRERVGRGTP